MEIIESFFESCGEKYPMYIASFDIGGRKLEYSYAYESGSHSDELRLKFEKKAIDAMEHERKRIERLG